MPTLTYPIEMAIKAARIMAGFLLSVGTFALVGEFVMLESMRAKPDTWKLEAALAVICLVLYILPGVLMLLLARKMASAAKWPFILAMVISGLAIVGVSAQTLESSAGGDLRQIVAGGCVDVLIGAPAVYLLVRCWNALPELRFVRGQAAPRRGFQPIMRGEPGGAKAATPPRKPTTPRLPPRPNLPGR